MKNYIDLLNEKVGRLLIELNRTELDQQKRTIDIETKRKIETITDYYRTVLKGAIQFSNDVINYQSKGTGVILDSNPNIGIKGNIELDVNPPIDMDLKNISNVSYNNRTIITKRNQKGVTQDIILDENPPINLDLRKVKDVSFSDLEQGPTVNMKSNGDIELDENPPVNLDLKRIDKYTFSKNDISLDMNPPIDMDVKKVNKFSYDNDAIEFDKNPDISIDLMDVEDYSYNGNDINLNENPNIDVDLKDVSKYSYSVKDISLDENPDINMNLKEVQKAEPFNDKEKAKKKVNPFSNDALGIELKDVNDKFSFNADSFKKEYDKKRKEILERRKKGNKKDQ